jgi:hypothetical protein
MNRDEAKFLLSACRPGGQDALDPQFREALELLKHDHELTKWFAEEQDLDRRLAKQFCAFPVPPDLQSQLLAARKIIPPPRWWRKPAWLTAAAACITVIVTAALMFLRRPDATQYSDFQAYAAAIAVDRFGGLELMSKDISTVRQWLHDRKAPDDFAVPAGLRDRPSLGCRVLKWNGQTVSFVCFRLQGGQVVHLFVLERGAWSDLPNAGTREVAASGGSASSVCWSDGRCTYVLASTQQNEKQLKELL